MTVVRSLYRISLQRLSPSQIRDSGTSITRTALICPRCTRPLTDSPLRKTLSPARQNLRYSLRYSLPEYRHLRGYATIIHNQKYNEDNMPLTLEITPNCAKQLQKIQARENNPNLMLRITVESGGCHGYQYLMSLSESYNPEEDALFERDGMKVVVDTISLGLITGSKVDYSTELIGSQFKIIDNPAASSNCGCGASFDLDFSKQVPSGKASSA